MQNISAQNKLQMFWQIQTVAAEQANTIWKKRFPQNTIYVPFVNLPIRQTHGQKSVMRGAKVIQAVILILQDIQ